MALAELIGTDGRLSTATIGTVVTTGTLTDGTHYIIGTVGGSSALPAGAVTGYVFVSDGTEDISASGDTVYPLTITQLCSVTSYTFSSGANEISISTLCDTYNKYRAGRPDLSGSISGIWTVGVDDQDSGFANSQYDIVSQADDGGALTISLVDNSTQILVLTLQNSTASGETEEKFFCPATILSFENGADGEGAQTYTVNFRPTEHPTLKLHLYKKVVA